MITVMKLVHKAYLFPLRPTATQKSLLDQHFGAVRFVYNRFLDQRLEQYNTTGKSDDSHALSKALTQLKKQPDYSWLNDIGAQVLQGAIANLETAYKNFFRGTSKFPRFKAKKRSRPSFIAPQGCRLENRKVIITKFSEGIRCIAHREVEGTIKKMTFSRAPSGKYFVSILTEVEHKPMPKTGKSVGIDLGLKDIAVTSTGQRFDNPRFTKRNESRLAHTQRHLARKQRGSNTYEKQRRKVAKLHEVIANTRRDALHKLSHELVLNNDTIVVEDLNVRGMMANHRLAKSIGDVGWAMLIRMIEYKSAWNDRIFVKVGRFFPSSKTCHECGFVNHDLTLDLREWTCPNGHVLDRDVNAAKNILKEGMRMVEEGLLTKPKQPKQSRPKKQRQENRTVSGDNTDGGHGKTSTEKHRSAKSGAQCETQ